MSRALLGQSFQGWKAFERSLAPGSICLWLADRLGLALCLSLLFPRLSLQTHIWPPSMLSLLLTLVSPTPGHWE